MEIGAVSSSLVPQGGALPGNQVQQEEPNRDVESTQDLQAEGSSSAENASAEGENSVPAEETAPSGHDGDLDVFA